MSGRVSDLEVNPQDPSHFYVAYASGGLGKLQITEIALTLYLIIRW